MYELERVARKPRRTNEILGKMKVFYLGRARPATEVMASFIAEHRGDYGIEPICAMLPIATSTCYERKAREADPRWLPGSAQGVGDGPDLRSHLGRFCVRGARHRCVFPEDREPTCVAIAAKRSGPCCPGAGVVCTSQHPAARAPQRPGVCSTSRSGTRIVSGKRGSCPRCAA